MADAFPLTGNVDPRTFPFTIMDLHRGGATGSLKVEGPTYHKALYFRSGRMLFGSSNDPRDQLGAILIESGKLTPEQLEDVNGKVGPGNPLAKLLSESGLVSQRELGDAARAKVERIVSDLLNYESGSYEFEDGVLPKGAVDLKLSTEKTAIAAVRRLEDRAFVLRHIDSLQTVLSPTPELAEGAASLEGELGTLPQCLDGQRTIKEVAEAAGMDDFETAKLSCALLFLGWAQVGGGGADAGPVVVPEIESEPEVISDDEAPLFVSPDSGGEIDLGAAAESGFEAGADPALVIASPDDDATVAIPTPSFGSETPEGHGAFVPTDEETEVGDDELAPQFLPDSEAPVMSAESEPADETQQDFGPPDEDLPSTGIFDQSYSPTMPSAKAYSDEASDVPTEIGLSLPPTPVEETGPPPPPPEPDAGSMPPQKRPSREDLAALDALLNSRSLDSGLEPGKPDDDSRWEPQFLPGQQTPGAARPSFGGPGGTGRLRPQAESSWVQTLMPIALGLGVVLIAAGLAVWSLGGPGAVMAKLGIRSPEPTPAPPTTTLPTPAPPSSTLVAEGALEGLPEGSPVPEGQPTPTPDPALSNASSGPDAGAPETPAPATTLPAAAATPTPPPANAAPPRPASAGGVDGARAALRAGRFDEAAAGFAAGLRSAGDFSVQVLVACSTETVAKAVRNVDARELFIVPVDLQGRACYRMCWGMYGSDREAQAGARSVPAYFREGGGKPRVVRTSEIIP